MILVRMMSNHVAPTNRARDGKANAIIDGQRILMEMGHQVSIHSCISVPMKLAISPFD
jgi:hypothetical protein